MQDVVTLDTAADTVGLAPATLRRWARLGRIRTTHLRLPVDVRPLSGFPDGWLPATYVRAAELWEDLAAFPYPGAA